MRRKHHKSEALPNNYANDVTLESELILLSKREVEARSDHRRSHGLGGFRGLGVEMEPVPTVGSQLITQLADLDLYADIRMDDSVQVRLELPLWQVLELSEPGNMNNNLVDLLNASLDNRAGDPAYLARLNALILKEAQDGEVPSYRQV